MEDFFGAVFWLFWFDLADFIFFFDVVLEVGDGVLELVFLLDFLDDVVDFCDDSFSGGFLVLRDVEENFI